MATLRCDCNTEDATSPTRTQQASHTPGNMDCSVYKMRLQKLLQVGSLAQKRLARGLKLNRTEAVALIACQLHERIRDGIYSVADLMQHGKNILGRRHVVPGVVSAIHDIQVEGTFPDG